MQKPKILRILILTVLLLSLTINVRSSDTLVSADTRADAYVFHRSWGGGADQIRYPRAIEIGPDNRIYAINNGRMTVIDQDTRTYQVWLDHFFPSTLGAYIPLDIAFDLDGNILYPVCDRIHKFSPSGDLLLSWGELGTDPGKFKNPSGIAVDNEGRIYVADSGNYRIQVFSSDGNFIRMWTLGDVYPYSIALGKHDEIFIGDLTNRCVQKYDIDGNHMTSFGEGIIGYPYAIATDEVGQVFVVSQYLSTIEVFSFDGTFLRTIGNRHNPGDQPGEFQWLEGVAVDQYNNLYVADTRNNRVQKLTNSGEFIISWGEKISLPGEFNSQSDILITKQDHLLVVDTANHRIQLFDKDGQFITKWGSEGYADDQLKNPSSAVIDEKGIVYIADHDNSRVQIFSDNGIYLDTWSGGQSYLYFPLGIEFNKLNGYFYFTDSGNKRIQVINNIGEELFTWGEFGSEPGNFSNPNKIVSDKEGNVFVSDGMNRIQKFDQYGNFISSWGETGDYYYFNFPSGLDIDKQDKLYVSDSYNHQVQIFDLQGYLMTVLGRQGRRPGEFYIPRSTVVDEVGDLFVLESGNNRVQVFSQSLPDPDPYSGLVSNGSFENAPYISDWAYGGALPVSLSTHATHYSYALQLGQPISQTEQGLGDAWAHTTFYVRHEMVEPTLVFKYNMFVNDIMDYYDFFVAIQDGVGLNHLETVLRAGYPGSVAPAAGTDMGWRSARFDL